MELLIGDVGKRTGLPTATIRYYESLGLIASPPRSPAGYRRYGETTLQELAFIKKAQGLGFSLEAIDESLQLIRAGRAPCARVLELARRHLAAVELRIAELIRFRDDLAADIEVQLHRDSAPPRYHPPIKLANRQLDSSAIFQLGLSRSF